MVEDVQIKDLEYHYFQELFCNAHNCKFNSYTRGRTIYTKEEGMPPSIGYCTRQRGMILTRTLEINLLPFPSDPAINANFKSDPIPICVYYRRVII